MVRARVVLPLLVAAILGLGGCQAQARRIAATEKVSADDAFLQARLAALRGDQERFERFAEQASDPLLGHYLEFWRLRMRLGPRNASGIADPAIRTFIDRHPGTPVADQLRHDWLIDLARRGEWTTFDEQHPQLVQRDNPQVDCWGWLGGLRRDRRLPPEAAATLYQPRELGEGCGTLVEALARDGSMTQADLWRRLKLSLEAGGNTTVRRVGALLQLPPEALDAALTRPARALATGADTRIAVIALAQLARQDPDDAAERLAALPGLPADERAFVTSQIAAHAMRRLAPRALEWTRGALDADASDETWVWLARAALRGSDWKTLNAVIEKMGPARRDPTWVYWHARTHAALGRPADAERALKSIAGQFNFYGQLAAEELGALTTTPQRAAPPTAQEIEAAAQNVGFARSLRFYAIGLRAEGNREWNFQLRGMNDRQLLAGAALACQRAVLDRCVHTADRTLAEHDFAMRFVTPFIEQLSPVAQDRGLDPAWVYGLIRQESRFIMDARSTAGAQGLMQIIPPTARWIARKLGVQDFRVEHLHDLGTNLRFGTFYLKSVLDDLDGSALLASAGYNAGPGRPRNWRSTLPSTVEGAVFAEIIPFTETRDYVKKVLSNATYYGALLSGQPQSLKARLGSVAPQPAKKSELP